MFSTAWAPCERDRISRPGRSAGPGSGTGHRSGREWDCLIGRGRPRQGAFGEDAYATLALKAAALLHSLARPCARGRNKRLGWLATVVFLDLNGNAPGSRGRRRLPVGHGRRRRGCGCRSRRPAQHRPELDLPWAVARLQSCSGAVRTCVQPGASERCSGHRDMSADTVFPSPGRTDPPGEEVDTPMTAQPARPSTAGPATSPYPPRAVRPPHRRRRRDRRRDPQPRRGAHRPHRRPEPVGRRQPRGMGGQPHAGHDRPDRRHAGRTVPAAGTDRDGPADPAAHAAAAARAPWSSPTPAAWASSASTPPRSSTTRPSTSLTARRWSAARVAQSSALALLILAPFLLGMAGSVLAAIRAGAWGYLLRGRRSRGSSGRSGRWPTARSSTGRVSPSG